MSREMAQRLLHGEGSWVPIPRWYRALTAEWIPERLHSEFGLHVGEQDKKSAARAGERLPQVYRRLPASLRFVGPYREAQHRLAGRNVDPMTRASNRFWMGQTRMMFAELAG
jgi:hypothetical protein